MSHTYTAADVLVSVVIPMYNAEQHLKKTLDSILGQSYQRLEIIIIDDGSTDNSKTIAEEYAGKDTRIQLHTQNNKGAAPARNRGIALASGKYILFLDADDLFEPDMVSHLLTRAEETTADIVICNFTTILSSTREVQELCAFNMKFLRQHVNPYCCCPRTESPENALQLIGAAAPWNKLFRTEFIRSNKLEFLSLSSANDLTFVYSACILAQRISFIDLPLVTYIIWKDSISHAHSRNIDNTPIAYAALLQNIKKHHLWPQLQNTFTISAAHTMAWNLLNTTHSPEKVNAHVEKWKKELPLDSRLLSVVSNPFVCVYLAIFSPEYTLILPEINEQLLSEIQELAGINQFPQLPVQILYASRQVEPQRVVYPVAMPVTVPETASDMQAVDLCRAAAKAPLVLYPGCSSEIISRAIKAQKIKYFLNRLAFLSPTAKTKRRILRLRIKNLQQLNRILQRD